MFVGQSDTFLSDCPTNIRSTNTCSPPLSTGNTCSLYKKNECSLYTSAPPWYTGIPLMNQPVALMNVAGAAEYMGVTERFMRRLVEERRIPYYKIGKYVRFSEEDLDDFLASVRILPKREVS